MEGMSASNVLEALAEAHGQPAVKSEITRWVEEHGSYFGLGIHTAYRIYDDEVYIRAYCQKQQVRVFLLGQKGWTEIGPWIHLSWYEEGPTTDILIEYTEQNYKAIRSSQPVLSSPKLSAAPLRIASLGQERATSSVPISDSEDSTSQIRLSPPIPFLLSRRHVSSPSEESRNDPPRLERNPANESIRLPSRPKLSALVGHLKLSSAIPDSELPVARSCAGRSQPAGLTLAAGKPRYTKTPFIPPIVTVIEAFEPTGPNRASVASSPPDSASLRLPPGDSFLEDIFPMIPSFAPNLLDGVENSVYENISCKLPRNDYLGVLEGIEKSPVESRRPRRIRHTDLFGNEDADYRARVPHARDVVLGRGWSPLEPEDNAGSDKTVEKLRPRAPESAGARCSCSCHYRRQMRRMKMRGRLPGIADFVHAALVVGFTALFIIDTADWLTISLGRKNRAYFCS